MTQKVIQVGNVQIGNELPFVLFGGMNVLESRDMAMPKLLSVTVTVTK